MSAPPKKMGLSLYANLLGNGNEQAKDASATISSAPVRYDTKKAGADEAAEQKRKDAALHFQPVRRPQAQAKANRGGKKGGGPGHAFSSSTTTASVAPMGTSSPDKQLQTPSAVTSTPSQQPPSVQRSAFEDWVGDEDDDAFYLDNKPKHERGGRKKKGKKGKQGGKEELVRTWSWDDVYDPSLPNSYAEYKGSEEQVMEVRDWKARLYYHQIKAAKRGGAKSEEEKEKEKRPVANSMFAPPASLSFAPPSFDVSPSKPAIPEDDDDEYYPPSVPSHPAGPDTSDAYEPPLSFSRPLDTSDSYEPPPAFSQTPASVQDDPTGEDAYAGRMRLGGTAVPLSLSTMLPLNILMPLPPFAMPQMPVPPPPQQLPTPLVPAVTPPILDEKAAADLEAKKANAAAKIAAVKAKIEAQRAAKAANGGGAAAVASPTPPVTAPAIAAPPPPPPPPPSAAAEEGKTEPETGSTISRAPVRYEVPAGPNTLDEDASPTPPIAEEETRSNRPGQKGFAERLLKRYGWEKGSGLGAKGNEGITTAIVAKAEKRKKLADAEGGGYRTPANMGKLVGGKRRKVGDGAATETGEGGDGVTADQPFGPLSAVIKLEGMLAGLDVEDEIVNKDLYGEIGREMEGSYGKVERVFIWRATMEEAAGDEVFVQFVSSVSALRAVGGCEGMEFAGNVVKARFWDGERFGRGEYA